jgi:hypothetical protein
VLFDAHNLLAIVPAGAIRINVIKLVCPAVKREISNGVAPVSVPIQIGVITIPAIKEIAAPSAKYQPVIPGVPFIR